MAAHFNDRYYIELAACGGFAGLDGAHVVGVAGVVEIRPDVGLAWAILSRRARRHMRQITTAAAVYLTEIPFARVECAVECDFTRAHEWARRLGFECECPRMRSYAGAGRDAALFARIKSCS